MTGVDIAALVLRPAVGGTVIAHGWNHAFGGGKLPGTARWFESIGILADVGTLKITVRRCRTDRSR